MGIAKDFIDEIKYSGVTFFYLVRPILFIHRIIRMRTTLVIRTMRWRGIWHNDIGVSYLRSTRAAQGERDSKVARLFYERVAGFIASALDEFVYFLLINDRSWRQTFGKSPPAQRDIFSNPSRINLYSSSEIEKSASALLICECTVLNVYEERMRMASCFAAFAEPQRLAATPRHRAALQLW